MQLVAEIIVFSGPQTRLPVLDIFIQNFGTSIKRITVRSCAHFSVQRFVCTQGIYGTGCALQALERHLCCTTFSELMSRI